MAVDRTRSLEMLARLGYAARGLVYLLVGGLAVLAAIGAGGQTGGSRSALATLLDEPFGRILLVVIGIGLLCFAAWRLVQAITDADRFGTSWKGRARRAGRFAGGFLVGSLGLSAIGIGLGRAAAGGEEQATRDWTAWLLAQPFGPWLVAALGVAVAATGLGFAGKAWRGDVVEHLRLDEKTRGWVPTAGRIGFAARGLVYLMIGGFLIVAAWQGSSAEARGLGGALETLRAQPYGWILLGLTAAGLFAFGVFGLVQAVYRRIEMPDTGEAEFELREHARRLRAAIDG